MHSPCIHVCRFHNRFSILTLDFSLYVGRHCGSILTAVCCSGVSDGLAQAIDEEPGLRQQGVVLFKLKVSVHRRCWQETDIEHCRLHYFADNDELLEYVPVVTCERL